MSPIADMLTRIRNAQAVGKERVFVPFSKIKLEIAKILVSSGYLVGVERRKRKIAKTEREVLDLELKYLSDNNISEDAVGAISGLRMVSKPSRRMYTTAKNIKPVRSGFGIAVISTPNGLRSSKDARKENVGGEIMFEIW